MNKFEVSYCNVSLGVRKLSIILLLFPIVCWGSGWNDYLLDIGDGYRIIKANSFEKGLEGPNRISVFPYNYAEIGPLTHYHKDSKYIFLKFLGRKDRNLFEGDTFKQQDSTKKYYFIVTAKDGAILGPLDSEIFGSELKRIKYESVNWISPKNPNFWRPLLGSLMFLGLAIPILFFKFWYLTFPVSFFFVYVHKKWKQRRKKKHSSTLLD